jgi:multisubunit Na+/H+ antiporter MnhF subunit
VNVLLLAAAVVVLGGVVPALVLLGRGSAVERLIGLELLGAITVLLLMLLAIGFGQPQYLIAPLVLVVLSWAGTLVFTRLLGRHP